MPVDFFEGHKQVHTWGGRMLDFHRSRVFKKTIGVCCVLALYIGLVHMIEEYTNMTFIIPTREGAGFGAALSILMVLRTNSAYDRWWKGRKHWGALVNTCRNLALKIQAFSNASDGEKALAGRYIVFFPYALRDHLRSGILDQTLAHSPEPVPANVVHLPSHLAGRLFARVKRWRDQGLTREFDNVLIDQHISALMDICGACERIRNSPLPLAHRALVPQLLALYLVLIPVSMELTLGNIAFSFLMSYFLIALELIAEEIEEPFGTDDDDLPLDKLCSGIGRSVRQILPEIEVLPDPGAGL